MRSARTNGGKNGAAMPKPKPTLADWEKAGWAVQSWIRSCFDVLGTCALCGSPDAHAHVNDCPWPQMRALLDRSDLP